MPTLRSLLPLVLLSALSISAFSSNATKQATQSHLPIGAEASISAVLGCDIPDYHARATANGFAYHDRTRRLATYFNAKGIDLKTGPFDWSMRFEGYGYGDVLNAPESTTPVAAANRLEYRRGTLTEWYVNGPAGLEQGFTLIARPERKGNGPLTISMALGGTLTAVKKEKDDGLLLTDQNGKTRLRYGGLTAFDASGTKLQAHIEIQGYRLLVKVNDAQAQYPIVIDPLVQLAELTASDAMASDAFGAPVATNSDTIVVGAIGFNTNQGAAYVFVKPADGWSTTSTFTAKLTASTGRRNNYFGTAVAVDGDTIVVGALGAGNYRGAAYVFLKPSTGWVSTSQFAAKLTASDRQPGDLFGSSVAVSGNTIIAGARFSNVGSGSAYIFVKPSRGWATTSTFKAKLNSPEGSESRHFGYQVRVIGTTILATADLSNVGSNSHQGAAYIYERPATGWTTTSTPNAKLTAWDGSAEDDFGYSASLSFDSLVIGNFAGYSGQGAAYVFQKPATGWATTSLYDAKFTSPIGASGDLFGAYVAISGNGVLVGAPSNVNGGQGSAYLYVKPKTGWVTTARFNTKLFAQDGGEGDGFGWVAVAGSTKVVGAPGKGAVYVFGP